MVNHRTLGKFPSINGLRALSITFVILSHLDLQYGLLTYFKEISWINPLVSLLSDGSFGVNVFFVISGFLITSLLLNEEETSGKVSLKNFYIRRTLRIFPAYFFLLLVYFILQLAGYISISKASWLTALTYTKYFNWQLDWYTAHAWSLSVEEHFYIFWPLIFLAGKKVRNVVCILLILAVPLLRVFVHLQQFSWLEYYFNEMTIFKRIDSISIGCFFALYREEILRRINKYWAQIFYFSIISLLVLEYLSDKFSYKFIELVFTPLGTTNGTLANILIALLMMYSVFGPQKTWYKMLNLKWVNYIGLLSYSIYLWQQLFLYKTSLFFSQMPVNLLFLAFAALFSYNLIEKPFLKLKSKFL